MRKKIYFFTFKNKKTTTIIFLCPFVCPPEKKTIFAINFFLTFSDALLSIFSMLFESNKNEINYIWQLINRNCS